MNSTMELEWLGYLGVAIGVLLPVSILLAIIFQFRMNRRTPRLWPEGMEPPEEGVEPVSAKLVDRQSLGDVIYTSGRIRMNEKLLKRRSGLPWLVPYKTPSKPGKLWLGRTGLVFYYRHRDSFYRVAYADITGIDSFQGWYREYDFRKHPALIVHHEIGEDRIAVFQLTPGITERFARLLAERVSRGESEEPSTDSGDYGMNVEIYTAFLVQSTLDIVLPIIVGIVLLPVMIGLLLTIRRGTQLSKYSLPDFLPGEQPPDDPAFGKRGAFYAGTLFAAQKMFGVFPVPVVGKGYHIKGNGKVWLSEEAVMIHRYFTSKPLVIPFALIHVIDVRIGFFAGKRVPGYVLHITWGRKELPMVSGIQISRRRDLSEEWACEISRRAEKWRDRLESEASLD